MSLSLIATLIRRFSALRPLLLYAATWSAVLAVIVAVASFSPEVAFMWAISPASSFSRECEGAGAGTVRMPLDLPGEVLCFPARMFARSGIDMVVPPVFAAVIVAASAWALRAVCLCGEDEAR